MTTTQAKKAAKFRTLAESMAQAIDHKLNPATADQNPTPRRMSMIEGMRREGQRMQLVQGKLLTMADLLERGELPKALDLIKSRKDVEQLVIYDRPQGDVPEDAWKEARVALLALPCPTIEKETPKERQIRDLERALIGRKIPGYFPTPAPVVAMMLAHAQLETGMRVLEPSAGKGNIAQAIRDAGCEPDVIEMNYDLREILALKGFNLIGQDFTTFRGEPYDRVLMNPPFERFQDIVHVQRAFDLLKPGGRLVAIMGESAFFRKETMATDFRTWLEGLGGTSESLARAFEKNERSTSATSRMVVIDKPL